MGKKILKNIHFIYKDGNEYSFDTKQNDSYKNKFDLYIWKVIRIKIAFLFSFVFYKEVSVEYNYGHHYNYTSIDDYKVSISFILDLYIKNNNRGGEIQKLFENEFDGFISVPEDMKKIKQRMNTIKKIIK